MGLYGCGASSPRCPVQAGREDDSCRHLSRWLYIHRYCAVHAGAGKDQGSWRRRQLCLGSGRMCPVAGQTKVLGRANKLICRHLDDLAAVAAGERQPQHPRRISCCWSCCFCGRREAALRRPHTLEWPTGVA